MATPRLGVRAVDSDAIYGCRVTMASAADLPRAQLRYAWNNARRVLDDFMSAVDALDEKAALELRPAHWGESYPVVNLVTTMLTEHVHHLAEIGVLRDLRRGHARTQPPAADIPGPDWWSGRPATDA
jgi:hypothetical protein